MKKFEMSAIGAVSISNVLFGCSVTTFREPLPALNVVLEGTCGPITTPQGEKKGVTITAFQAYKVNAIPPNGGVTSISCTFSGTGNDGQPFSGGTGVDSCSGTGCDLPATLEPFGVLLHEFCIGNFNNISYSTTCTVIANSVNYSLNSGPQVCPCSGV